MNDAEILQLIERFKLNPRMHYVTPNGLKLKVYRIEFIQAAPHLEGTIRCVWAGGFRLDMCYLRPEQFVNTELDEPLDTLCDKLFSGAE